MCVGLESGLETVLVLSGVSKREDLEEFAFRPDHVVNSLHDVVQLLTVDE